MRFTRSFTGIGEKPVATVPRPVIAILLFALSLQVILHGLHVQPAARIQALPDAMSESYLNVLSLGEPVALAKALMLWLQGFDHQAGVSVPFTGLDYVNVEAWLERIITLDPGGHYPLLSAVRIYSEVQDEDKQRRMLDFSYRKFLEDPAGRWPWLAHAVYVARHRLGDIELALKLARDLRTHTPTDAAPAWARQMELFVLADMGEVEAAKVLLGGLIENGEITDPKEIEFLTSRLDNTNYELEITN